jgi:hypothetical protein
MAALNATTWAPWIPANFFRTLARMESICVSLDFLSLQGASTGNMAPEFESELEVRKLRPDMDTTCATPGVFISISYTSFMVAFVRSREEPSGPCIFTMK